MRNGDATSPLVVPTFYFNKFITLPLGCSLQRMCLIKIFT